MIADFDNTNEKNVGQVSKNNPGWKGSGVPKPQILLKRFTLNFKNLWNGNLNLFLNNFKANYANTYAFIITKKKHRVICPCCNWTGTDFITTCNSKRVNYSSKCPQCDSRSRHRGLSVLLTDVIKNKNLELLFFAPERILLNLLNDKFPNIHVQTTDFYSIDVDYPNEDIQKLSFIEQRYDYILCNHVIEHVPNDDLAFKELARILKINGKAVITIPGDYHLESTDEFDRTDGNGHYRHYAMDVVEKMKMYFSNVEVVDLHSISNLEFGVRQNDLAFICKK